MREFIQTWGSLKLCLQHLTLLMPSTETFFEVLLLTMGLTERSKMATNAENK